MAEKTRARAWRPAFAAIATTLITAVGLVPAAPARAGLAGEPGDDTIASHYRPRYTYVDCEGRPNTGALVRASAAGRGQVRIKGSVTPCRVPKHMDAVAIGWYLDLDDTFFDRGIARYIPYRARPGYYVNSVAKIPAGTKRVCLASTPTQIHGCVRVTVPTLANGEPGVPVVHERIPVTDADLPIFYPNCGSCWP